MGFSPPIEKDVTAPSRALTEGGREEEREGERERGRERGGKEGGREGKRVVEVGGIETQKAKGREEGGFSEL